jgi:hypothetical protein
MENNELIEGFWISQGGKPHDPADLWFYESSWDMLMPVVEKIDSLHNNHPFEVAEFCNGYQISAKINIIYQAVIEFIKWHNQNNK